MRKTDRIALILIVIFTCLKLINLDSDPPPFMSVAEYGDPAQYAYNARNKVIFGTWEIDEKWNLMWLTIVPHYVTYLTFLIFGVSIKSMNLVPLFFSAMILLIFYLILKDSFSEKIALVGVIILGTNFLFFTYSRIADRIPEMLFFALLSIFLWQKGIKGFPILLFFSGICLWLAYNSKPKILYFIAIFFIAHVLEIIGKRERIKKAMVDTTYLLTGLILSIFVWLFLTYIPHREIYERFGSYNIRIMFANIKKDILFHWFSRAPFSIHETFVPIGIFVSILMFFLIRAYFHKKEKLTPLEVMGFCWAGFGYSLHSILFWRPLRYYFDFLFPMLFIFFGFAHRVFGNRDAYSKKKVNIIELFLYFILSLFIFSHILRRLYTPYIYQKLSKFFLIDIFLSIVSVSIIILFIRYSNLFKKFPRIIPKILISIVIMYTIFINSKEIIHYLSNSKYQMKEISEDFARAFPGAIMAGVWAIPLSMNNDIKAYHCWPRMTNTDPDFLRIKKVQYAFLWDDIETPFYMNNFPEMKDANLLARYHILHSTVEEPYYHRRKFWNLFDLRGKRKEREQILEAETLTGPFGMPRFEEKASRGFVLSTQKKFSSYPILDSPPVELKEGTTEITFFMKTPSHILKDTPVCQLILLREDGKLRKRKIVYSHEFKMPSLFIPIKWRIQLSKTSKWKIQVLNYAHTDFYIDYLEIKSIK
ncbi:MAG: glycosyltransferase family 39 protein [Acidobacteriota bacterium]